MVDNSVGGNFVFDSRRIRSNYAVKKSWFKVTRSSFCMSVMSFKVKPSTVKVKSVTKMQAEA